FAPWLRHLQSAGYKFHLVYLWLPIVELALARVAERVRGAALLVNESSVYPRAGNVRWKNSVSDLGSNANGRFAGHQILKTRSMAMPAAAMPTLFVSMALAST